MENNTETVISKEEINLDEILGTPGADSVMLPDSKEEKKPNVFSSKDIDLSFLNEEIKNEDKEGSEVEVEEGKEGLENNVSKKEPTPSLDSIIDEIEGEDKPKENTTGSNITAIKKLIEKGVISPFEDADDIDSYTEEEIEELIEANFSHKAEQMQQEIASQFFSALPEELQYAAKYVADGGQDLKQLFKVLSEVEETRELDIEKEDDQKRIIRSYLRTTNFGSDDEIEEEIQDWADRGSLKDKAEKFKPKLDKMQEQVVAQKLAKQEQLKKQKEESAKKYVQSVHGVISKGELSGVKLDKNVQALLYNGLVQPSYPSISGRPTNLLGHLLEKYQYVEPRHDLIAEVLWHLADPDGFKSKMKELGGESEKEKTVRQLKTEQAIRKTTSGGHVIVEEKQATTRIPRAQKNIFSKS